MGAFYIISRTKEKTNTLYCILCNGERYSMSHNHSNVVFVFAAFVFVAFVFVAFVVFYFSSLA